VPVAAFGMKMSLNAWAKLLNLPRRTLYDRINRGMPPEEALRNRRSKNGFPPRCNHPRKQLKNGQTRCPTCMAANCKAWRERKRA
jgi:hypothetical protein